MPQPDVVHALGGRSVFADGVKQGPPSPVAAEQRDVGGGGLWWGGTGGSLFPATSPMCSCLSVAETSGRFWGFCPWRAGLGWTPVMRHAPFFLPTIRLVWCRQGPIVLLLFHLGEEGAFWATSPSPVFSPALCNLIWYTAGLMSSSPV